MPFSVLNRIISCYVCDVLFLVVMLFKLKQLALINAIQINFGIIVAKSFLFPPSGAACQRPPLFISWTYLLQHLPYLHLRFILVVFNRKCLQRFHAQQQNSMSVILRSYERFWKANTQQNILISPKISFKEMFSVYIYKYSVVQETLSISGTSVLMVWMSNISTNKHTVCFSNITTSQHHKKLLKMGL